MKMIYPGDFVLAIEGGKYPVEDTRVLARIALNALLDAERFPVDLLEVRTLGIDARIAARAFLTYMANNPGEFSARDARRCEGLIASANANGEEL
ncbi:MULTISPECIES: hypothetical protein [Xanthomonas]|uniref:Uncharacterized protein n=2 Tax=Xanthomonas TaxID=338 RepID=A0AAW8ZPX6_9XANT|nr:MULTISPECIES: hypothetical protein [Xanthomonas]MCC8494629.1 hypothetical protein [Xanthomonas hortorum pv. gardneri]MCE4297898.1 hypothetical protein [Xanthomonas hortorum pv. vitians]MCE4303223.1 hypothetical protein [Xanthomonas hortorum pv. vitians]MCE4343240.1 hypothetical protein [Xanthomonas hortorum pv. vitians]MCE4366679.1 hypothetical protein [Xanthomonas hortorum pv. vitians]